MSSLEPAQKRQRSQLDRRDTDDKVQRVIESGRLDHISKSVWMARKNSKGEPVQEYIANEIGKRVARTRN